MRRRQRISAFLVIPLLMLTACQQAAPQASPDPINGHYVGSGGGGALPMVKGLTDGFAQLHPGIDWALEDVGSDASAGLVSQGQADIGFLSRSPKGDEATRVSIIPIGTSGTALAVNRRNPVENLSSEQIQKIFTGEITDWSQVGGQPGKIRVLIREIGSTTRSSFEAGFFKAKPAYTPEATEVYELGQTLSAIGSFEYAIGMVDLSTQAINDSRVRLLGIDGVAATQQNLDNGAYKLRRPLFLIVSNAVELKPAIRALVDFVRGSDGQRIIKGQ